MDPAPPAEVEEEGSSPAVVGEAELDVRWCWGFSTTRSWTTGGGSIGRRSAVIFRKSFEDVDGVKGTDKIMRKCKLVKNIRNIEREEEKKVGYGPW